MAPPLSLATVADLAVSSPPPRIRRDVVAASAADSEPSVDQKLFLVVSVALATVCFFTNLVQVAVFARPSAIKSVQAVLLLSQALSGLVASFVVAFPIHVISARGGEAAGEGGYAACYLGHSAVILLVILTGLGTTTLLLLDQYIKTNHPARYMTAGSNLVGWGAAAGGVWLFAGVVSSLPYAGWNSWEAHDASCHLSTLWPLSFTTFLTFLVGLHVAAVLLMWASTRAAKAKAAVSSGRVRRGGGGGGSRGGGGSGGGGPRAQQHDPEEAPIAGHPRSGVIIPGRNSNNPTNNNSSTITSHNNNNCGRVQGVGWGLTLTAVTPLLVHVVVDSSCAASNQCMSWPRHYHEDEAALPWATLFLAAAAVAHPLLYIFTDDQVSSATLCLVTRVCCWWCERRQQRLVPGHHGSLDTDTNVYVTSDTDQLVNDNT